MAFNKAKALREAEKLVSQGKIAPAIKQYLLILEREPSDLGLLNTVGDLYLREKNTTEALKQFNRLAESYTREAFTLKAIAIYKKISKLDSSTVEPLLKLGELYTIQGLGREAREQYSQAVEFYRKKNQGEKALEVFRKIIQLDPENSTHRGKYADLCEQIGRKEDAAQAYVDIAQVSLRRGDASAAAAALKKAEKLDPKNAQALLLKARLALASQRPEEAEKALVGAPELKEDAAARQLLLEAYLAGHKLDAAEKLVVEVYRSRPNDFTPVSSYASLCLEKGDFDAALKPLAAVADELIEQKNTGPLMEILRQIWSKTSNHIPTLELMHQVCERTADEFTLPEVLEALGHAYVQKGELQKAEAVYQKLVQREPENEHYKGLLKQVLQKLGKDATIGIPEALSKVEMALTPEEEEGAAFDAPVLDAEQAAVVKEALENSDLFSRYGLVEKAVAELEKALATYPDQIEIHQRIFEVCQRTQPTRAAQAAAELNRIFSERGDLASASKYQGTARPEAAPVARTDKPGKTEVAEFGLSPVVPLGGEPATEQSPPPSAEAPLGVGSANLSGSEPPPSAPKDEIDLSSDFASIVGGQEGAAAAQESPPFNYEEVRAEIDFYLEQGFGDEAWKTLESYEQKFPRNSLLAELHRRVEDRLAAPHATAMGAETAPQATVEPPAVQESSPPPAEEAGPEDWELAVSGYQKAEAGPLSVPEAPSPAAVVEGAPAGSIPAPSEPVAAGADVFSSLAGDLASSLEGIQADALLAGASQPPASKTAGTGANTGSPLSGLLEELGEPAVAQTAQDDPETHYNLGVAFREMGLLDEAIGEFQKVVKGAQKGSYPPHYLQACTLLASSFMEKKMPGVAAKWYLRALEMPDLDEEAMLALYYDLGVAYEQAGDARTALEKFTEVYSQNIDYRDVAEKIRLLQQKV